MNSRSSRPIARSARLRAPPAAATARERPSVVAMLMIWTLVVFTIVPEGFRYSLNDPTNGMAGMPTEGSALSRSIWIALLVTGLGLAGARSARVMRVVKKVNPYMLVFVALVAASAVWSAEPAITVRRFVRVLTIAVDGLALAVAGWHFTRFQSTLRPVITGLLIASILFVMISPEIAIEQSAQVELVNAWRGITTQKNALGSLAGIGLVLWFHAWLNKEVSRGVALSGAAIAATCLLKSRSSTSIMAAVFACTLLLMLLRSPVGLRRYLPYLVGLFLAALMVYSLAVLKLIPGSDLLLSPITALTGKDQTFSGRTAIWEILNAHIALRPLLGSGYGAYWNQIPTSPSMQMLQQLYFYPTEGHNGYLDVINDLGAVGGLCLFGYLVTFLRQGLRIFAILRPQGALYLVLLFQQMIGNLSESRWFNTLDFNFVIMTIATMAMARTLLDVNPRRP